MADQVTLQMTRLEIDCLLEALRLGCNAYDDWMPEDWRQHDVSAFERAWHKLILAAEQNSRQSI